MQHHSKIDQPPAIMKLDSVGSDKPSVANANYPAGLPDRSSMKLIPWPDIWSSLQIARSRGNGEMIEVFYDTLFKEAIFDDDGAWAFHQKKTQN